MSFVFLYLFYCDHNCDDEIIRDLDKDAKRIKLENFEVSGEAVLEESLRMSQFIKKEKSKSCGRPLFWMGALPCRSVLEI
jgi:hypothetical protein